MKKLLLIVSFLIAQTAILLAQPPLQTAKKDFGYEIVSNEGTNASAVIWHPAKKMYLTAIAGNASFPLEGFDESGKNKFTRSIGVDIRGMWYNPTTKAVEVNAAGEAGWFTLKMSTDLNSHEAKIIKEGQNQPDFQSVGTYDAAKKKVVFWESSAAKLNFYDRKNPSKTSSVNFAMADDNIENYNQTTVGYTGKKGYEFVVLNIEKRKLVFFDRIGKQTATTAIPNDAVLESMFRFSFANDRAFFYDVDNRVWTAYKVF